MDRRRSAFCCTSRRITAAETVGAGADPLSRTRSSAAASPLGLVIVRVRASGEMSVSASRGYGKHAPRNTSQPHGTVITG